MGGPSPTDDADFFLYPSGDPDYNQLQKTIGWRGGVAKLIIWNRMTPDGFAEGPAQEDA